MKIFNKSFFVAFAIYLILFSAIDYFFGNEFEWGFNLGVSFLGGLWFGYISNKRKEKRN